MHDTLPLLRGSDFPSIRRLRFTSLQANITLKCNQQCVHCHVNASPRRTEFMSEDTLHSLLEVLDRHSITTLDITGGAPELHPKFRHLVSEARKRDCHVIDRCNLTILLAPNDHTLPEFLAASQVEVIASLPCYLEDNVDRQRGSGVFRKSIEALRRLNALGYGSEGEALLLNLVYNPQGPVLPPPQQVLEETYRHILKEEYGVSFNQLFTLCNMPIQRFGSTLVSQSRFHDYITLLKQAHRAANLEQLMCRSLISVDWRGRLYDCDFNQMLDLPMRGGAERQPLHLNDLLADDVHTMFEAIAVADHCYGCTAGQGSSCSGAFG